MLYNKIAPIYYVTCLVLLGIVDLCFFNGHTLSANLSYVKLMHDTVIQRCFVCRKVITGWLIWAHGQMEYIGSGVESDF